VVTRISVSLPDPVAERLRDAAGGASSVSGYAAQIIREALLARAAQAAASYDRAHDDPEWERARLVSNA
jgi:hypothetical protein